MGNRKGRGPMLTCPTHWIVAGRGGEDLRGKVFKGHDLSVVLDDGFQVECPLFVADAVTVKENTAMNHNIQQLHWNPSQPFTFPM